MRKNKSILIIISLILLLCILSGCGQFNDAIGSTRGEDATETPTGDGGNNNGGQGDEKSVFTARLMYYNTSTGSTEHYIPNEDIVVSWTSGDSYYKCPIDKTTGIAQVTGLDGDYNVTLSKSPEGYIYNPNIYVATNNSNDTYIMIYDPVAYDAEGGSATDPIIINKLGVYRYVIQSKDTIPAYFAFMPNDGGRYSVESWVSTKDNNINPILDQVNGSAISGIYPGDTYDGGGASASFTTNFKYVEEIDAVYASGNNMFMFQIRAEVLDNVSYPITIDFAVQLDGKFAIDWPEPKLMIPKYPLKKVDIPSVFKLTYPEVKTSVKGQYLLDGKLYGYNSIDGYYHKLDENGEPNGELLFAYITTACRFNELSLLTIDAGAAGVGNPLTVANTTENYKFFLQGSHTINNGQVAYFCVYNTVSDPEGDPIICPCRKAGGPGYCMKTVDIDGDGVADRCPNCHPECRNVDPLDYPSIAVGGYADYTTNGMTPVTQELMECLQKVCIKNRYFYDGAGWFEDPENHGAGVDIDAAQDDQWLAFCAYYSGFCGVICDPTCPCAAGSTTPHSCIIGCKSCSNKCTNTNSEYNLSLYNSTTSIASYSDVNAVNSVLTPMSPSEYIMSLPTDSDKSAKFIK